MEMYLSDPQITSRLICLTARDKNLLRCSRMKYMNAWEKFCSHSESVADSEKMLSSKVTSVFESYSVGAT